ncbi:MAG TPA: ATP-dependent Clp protease proteolytic subunit [Vicinamibacterales bacterium]|nr:ATP-dependent Clp protease proteolytic subunit [Vicinamibacterales bacterium]
MTETNEIYAVFCGAIDQANAQRVVGSLAIATQNKVERLHILWQSAGGFVGDGVFLYNVFRSVPVAVTLYNAGQVSSAGAIAYLGARSRQTTASAIFMLHRSTSSPQFAGSARLERVAKSLALDDSRTEAILRAEMALPDELWNEMNFHDLYLSADEALKYGLAHAIGEFAPPPGRPVFNILG